MPSILLDRFTSSLGTQLSRRVALQAGVGLGGLAVTRASTAAQGATPAASPVAGGKEEESLFVQSFDSGSLMPKTGEAGVFVLTLQNPHSRTIVFADRPERKVGSAPIQEFLDGLGFSPTNPPNAALVIEPSPGETDIIVLELLNPRYDEAAQIVTYDVRFLDTFAAESNLTFQETPRMPQPAGEEFGAAELFIDDCPDLTQCTDFGGEVLGPLPPPYQGGVGTCWCYIPPLCDPTCGSCPGPDRNTLNDACTDAYGSACGINEPEDQCYVT